MEFTPEARQESKVNIAGHASVAPSEKGDAANDAEAPTRFIEKNVDT